MTSADIDRLPAPARGHTRLTPRQREMCEWIRAFMARKGYGPTVRELGEGLHIISPNGVLAHLKALEKKQVIRRDPKTSRSIVLLEVEPPGELERLREALESILGRLAPVRSAEPGEGDVCYSAYFSRTEVDRYRALLGEGG